ncbi:MAG TPA: hypothetical protein VGZ68_10990 [Acidimicrobiales bacterium]|jgi:hypothetical protein|nr:hypothetical protein [Acidimicrobiales bacterium]
MSIDSHLDDLFGALDPLTEERRIDNERRRDAVWMDVVSRTGVAHDEGRRRRSRRLLGASSMIVVVATVLVLAGLVPGTAPVNVAAADLTAAARADAAAAILPALGPGQYYYEKSAVSMVCGFSTPSMPKNETLNYVSNGTLESWTGSDGSGKVVITPSPVDANGSHFVTPQQHAQWLAAGSPFIPCALANASNTLNGNPANLNPGPSGGYVESGVGYSGFGFNLGSATVSTELASGTSVNNLPTDVAQIAAMLASGEINTDGSTSTTPQSCPYGGGSVGAPLGCTTEQQLMVIEALLQLPDASAKLGSVLYDVMAQMPGATNVGVVTDTMGRTGKGIVVTAGAGEEFEVVLDPVTGVLLASTALIASNTNVALSQSSSSPYTPEAQMTYGSIAVVQGVGTLPSAPS